MTKYLLPLLLLLSLPAISQTILPSPSQTLSNTICVDLEQARIITTSLQKYELLKPAYSELAKTNKELRITTSRYKGSLVQKDSVITQLESNNKTLEILYKASTNKASLWEKKAHRNGLRFWLLATLTALGSGYLLTH